jgi:hypothetical protein
VYLSGDVLMNYIEFVLNWKTQYNLVCNGITGGANQWRSFDEVFTHHSLHMQSADVFIETFWRQSWANLVHQLWCLHSSQPLSPHSGETACFFGRDVYKGIILEYLFCSGSQMAELVMWWVWCVPAVSLGGYALDVSAFLGSWDLLWGGDNIAMRWLV